MTDARRSFFGRLNQALGAFWHTLQGREARLPAPAPAAPPPLVEYSNEAALQLLALLQQEGRLIDFLQEDITHHGDADIGAAARVIHEGCNRVLRDHLTLEPVRGEEEGSRLTLEAGFDAAAVRLTGNVVGEPPFTGTLTHRGWRASKLQLPRVGEGHDASIIAPAEVDL